MAIPIDPLPDLSQYNYDIGDTVDVVTKQNAINAEIEAMGQRINATVASINTDVQAVKDAEQNLDAAQIVHAPGSGLPNEAGSAYAADVTTSATDVTAGRLMKVGDFGFGGNGVPISDWNNTPPINCFLLGSSSSTLNKPPGGATSGYQILRTDAQGNVLFIKQFGSGIDGDNTFSRVYTYLTDTWSEWVSEYNQTNILGTVSQSGGVPTGAILERGSNANGEYTKFANGTMICTITLTLEYFSATNIRATWTYPVSFAPNTGGVKLSYMIPIASELSAVQRRDGFLDCANLLPGVTSVTIRIIDDSSSFVSGDSCRVQLTAIGYWY